MRSPASEAVQRDRVALIALYEATDGANWDDSTGWLSDAPLGDWYGITTDINSGRVVKLSLSRNNLRGELPADLGRLDHLERLDLPNNELSGPLPAKWSQLSNLGVLGLSGNKLSGPLPAAWSCLGNLGWVYLQ